MIKKLLNSLYQQAESTNAQNICRALAQTGPHSTLLDVGCWDGQSTLVWAKAAQARQVFGIESVASQASLLKKRRIKPHILFADRDQWTISSSSVDCIISNQVVEHLTDLDFFFSQAARVLKPGGIIITSTNNLSSLHNLFALALGWAPFDLTNSSKKIAGIGNPLALHRGWSDPRGASWTHKCIYTSRWLAEWQRLYGLNHETTYGAGLYPFPAFVGQIFVGYSAFITLICRKNP